MRKVAKIKKLFHLSTIEQVDLYGDMFNWLKRISLHQASKCAETELELFPGVYSYKFKNSSEEWFLDSRNPRTRSISNCQNSVLVVEGTAEPILHVPHSPFLFKFLDGRVCLRALLRKGYGEELFLQLRAGGKTELIPMQLLTIEDEHLVFECYLSGAEPKISYLFQIGTTETHLLVGKENTGCVIQLLEADLASLILVPQLTTPSWWQEAICYTVFLDRFRRGDSTGDCLTNWNNLADNSEDYCFERNMGGNLSGVIEAIPYLASLGITVLQLTPFIEAQNCHYYDTINYYEVDSRLGNKNTLLNLIQIAHKYGIKVFFDFAITHVNTAFFAFQDVIKHGLASKYFAWFQIKHYPFIDLQGKTLEEYTFPGYEHYPRGRWQEPLFNLNNSEVQEYICQVFEYWSEFGADGFRIDAAADVPLELGDKIVSRVRKTKQDIVFWGETIPNNTYRWNSVYHANTDFNMQDIMLKLFATKTLIAGQAVEQIKHRLFMHGSIGQSGIQFANTHDQHRFLSHYLQKNSEIYSLSKCDFACGFEPESIPEYYLLWMLMLCRSNIPLLYYGDEIGLFTTKSFNKFEGNWSDRQPFPWGRNPSENKIFKFLQTIIKLRKEHKILTIGTEKYLQLTNSSDSCLNENIICLQRELAGESIFLIMNCAKYSSILNLQTMQGEEIISENYLELFNLGEVKIDNKSIFLPGFSAVLIKPAASLQEQLALQNIIENNLNNALTSFVELKNITPSFPLRVNFSITENCNLSCKHCINHIPEIKESAQNMQPWLIAECQDLFAASDYFAFTHGGESLVSPQFFAILEKIKQVKQLNNNKPYTVHLLTNGMLLNEKTLNKLHNYNVNSIAISLDGATHSTNDFIREGGDFSQIVKNISALVKIREKLGWDIRVGISFVVAKSNVHELPELARLASSLGIDWVKLEEMHPSNAFAIKEMLDLNSLEMQNNLNIFSQKMLDTGMVFVNHLNTESMCECSDITNKSYAEFRLADNFANRNNYHTCRALWEQLCINPNGDVYTPSFDGIYLGNLLNASLLELWNSPVIQFERQRIISQHRCGN